MDPFFANPNKKRKRSGRTSAATSTRPVRGRAKRGEERQANATSRGRPAPPSDASSVESHLEDERQDFDRPDDGLSEEEESRETPAQKRVRLAKAYLSKLQTAKDREAEQGFDAADIERDYIADRLQKDVLAGTGKAYIRIADTLRLPIAADVYHTSASSSKGKHRLACTAAVASSDLKYLYTASKDGSLIKWDLASALVSLEDGVENSRTIKPVTARSKTLTKSKAQPPSKKGKQKEITSHTSEIWALAVSDDGKHLVSGGADKVVGIWNVQGSDLEWRRGLAGHKDSIASLTFRKATSQVYTSSFDRTVKIYDAAALTYIDTLFGHQDKIMGISALRAEVAVTAGGSDKSLRFWKMADDSQLVFRGGGTGKMRQVLEGDKAADDVDEEMDGLVGNSTKKRKRRVFVEGSIECCAMIDDSHFISGGDSGTIALWTTGKKKPIFQYNLAHGTQTESLNDGQSAVETPRWITSVAALPYSDLFATGSWDGHIRLWKIEDGSKSFKFLGSIAAAGVVNSLQIVPAPKVSQQTSHKSLSKGSLAAILVASTGQEHRLGRWFKVKEGRNAGLVVALHHSTPSS